MSISLNLSKILSLISGRLTLNERKYPAINNAVFTMK